MGCNIAVLSDSTPMGFLDIFSHEKTTKISSLQDSIDIWLGFLSLQDSIVYEIIIRRAP